MKTGCQGLGSDVPTLSSSEVITDCQEGLQRQALQGTCSDKNTHCVSFRETKTVLRAVPSQTMTGTLRRTVLLHDNNRLFQRGHVRPRYNMVETHSLFLLELFEWHFPHILHTSKGHVRSPNFEELSSRPSRRGVVKQNI